ncbi:MAG: thioredoxin family protein [Saprospiraceae bacterium]|nr:thioredoxin family protein [Saprospiraceae bacterium]
MSLTESNMLELGTEAPFFRLPDTVTGDEVSLDDVASDVGTVIMFLCNHCPYVIHVNPEIVRLAADYKDKGITFVGISSNDVEKYPQDGPEKMKEHAASVGYTFPYLYDESQNVAKDYDAACTPDFYLFDGDRELIYRGQLDGSRPGSAIAPTGADLRAALDALISRRPVATHQRPSAGCNIKWK